nr:hypothetical protein [Tanacetum cinerariifolium]
MVTSMGIRQSKPKTLRGVPFDELVQRVVEFEEAPNKEGSMAERESKGRRPSEQRVEEGWKHGGNLLPLLAAHPGRSENGQPLQSTLTSRYGGNQPSTNLRGNLPPNSSHVQLWSSHNGPIYPSSVPPNGYPFYAQPINPLPNVNMYQYGPGGLFIDSTGCVTPFVCWIEDYPLPDRLKMPPYMGSYDGKRDL